MGEIIEIEVGDLYAQLHANFSEEIGEDYDTQIRQVFENQIHQFNQQLDRVREAQAQGATAVGELDAEEMNLDDSA